MTTVQRISSLAVLSGSLMSAMPALASVVYDNSTTDLNRFYAPSGGTELGDEIFLAGSDRTITDFRFETFLSNNASGNETGQLIFRLNDGPPVDASQRGAPKTEVFRSDIFDLGLGRQVVIASGLNVALPPGTQRFTWSVVLNGIDQGEQAGLMLYSPPTVGSSYNDMWQNAGSSWTLNQIDNGAIDATFAARIVAVPEPGTLTLGALGAVALVGLMRRKRS